eukprot:6605401-Prymnesium_polylepis.1
MGCVYSRQGRRADGRARRRGAPAARGRACTQPPRQVGAARRPARAQPASHPRAGREAAPSVAAASMGGGGRRQTKLTTAPLLRSAPQATRSASKES